MKKILNIILLLAVGLQLNAQQEMSLSLMNHLTNSTKSNPAYHTTHQWVITLPSVGFSMLHTGPSFNDIYKKMESGKYRINENQALDKFEANNIFAAKFDADVIGVHFSWEDHIFSFLYGATVDAAIDYTGAGAKLLLRGNGQYIGDKLSIGPAINISAYDKLGIGYARKIDKWNFGGRLNLLFGRKALATSKHLAELETSSDYYAINLRTDYKVHSADFLNIDMNTNEVSFSDMSYKPFQKKGFGIGVDLGVSYQVYYDINVYASISNIGTITWKTNTASYESNNHVAYDGVRLESLAKLDTASLSGMLDSIQKFVDFEKTEETFKTKLGPKFLVGGAWNISENTIVNGVVDVTSVLNHYLPAVGIGIQQQLKPWVRVGGSLSYQNQKVNHLGLNTTFKFGPVQLFMATDNVLTFVMPSSANTMHFRTGINLKFGKSKRRTYDLDLYKNQFHHY